MNLPSSSLLYCSKPLLYAVLGYTVLFCTMNLSSSPCGTVVLHQVIRDGEITVLGFLRTLLCACLCVFVSVLCRHCPTQQLALPPSAVLHIPSCLFSNTSHLSVTRERVSRLLSDLLSPDAPLSTSQSEPTPLRLKQLIQR